MEPRLQLVQRRFPIREATHASTVIDVNLAANYYAFAFWKAGDKKAARAEFEKAAGLYSGIPWCYVGADGYRAALAECW